MSRWLRHFVSTGVVNTHALVTAAAAGARSVQRTDTRSGVRIVATWKASDAKRLDRTKYAQIAFAAVGVALGLALEAKAVVSRTECAASCAVANQSCIILPTLADGSTAFAAVDR